MRKISILEFPSNLGLKEPFEGHAPGVSKLPGWLKQHGFHDQFAAHEIVRLQPPPYSMQLDTASGVRNADAIAVYATQQAVVVKKVLSAGNFALVIGGDCSILIGNTIALKQHGNYALFFLDGHTDFMWPALSETGGAAGMDLAIATGNGHEKLTNIEQLKPYLREAQVWCVGNREYGAEYVQPILNSAIHYFDLSLLRQTGIEECVQSFLKMVAADKLDGFWIHLDVDVLDDAVMPAVDSRTEGGLSYAELDLILQLLLTNKKAAGLNITILDPERDPTGKYTEPFVQSFCSSFNAAFKK